MRIESLLVVSLTHFNKGTQCGIIHSITPDSPSDDFYVEDYVGSSMDTALGIFFKLLNIYPCWTSEASWINVSWQTNGLTLFTIGLYYIFRAPEVIEAMVWIRPIGFLHFFLHFILTKPSGLPRSVLKEPCTSYFFDWDVILPMHNPLRNSHERSYIKFCYWANRYVAFTPESHFSFCPRPAVTSQSWRQYSPTVGQIRHPPHFSNFNQALVYSSKRVAGYYKAHMGHLHIGKETGSVWMSDVSVPQFPQK